MPVFLFCELTFHTVVNVKKTLYQLFVKEILRSQYHKYIFPVFDFCLLFVVFFTV